MIVHRNNEKIELAKCDPEKIVISYDLKNKRIEFNDSDFRDIDNVNALYDAVYGKYTKNTIKMYLNCSDKSVKIENVLTLGTSTSYLRVDDKLLLKDLSYLTKHTLQSGYKLDGVSLLVSFEYVESKTSILIANFKIIDAELIRYDYRYD